MGHRKSSSVSLSGQKSPLENRQGAESVVAQREGLTHGPGTSNNDDGASGSGSGDHGDASQRLDAARAALLRSKQAELDAIEDRHDDLIREAFHLERWTTLVTYDPVFKAKYDLIGGTSSSAGPSRRTTRRALQDRVEKLKGTSAGPSVAASSPIKRPSASVHDDSSIWSILGFSAKGKGKDRDPRSPKNVKEKALPASVGAGTSLVPPHEPPSVSNAGSRARVTRQSISRASLPKMPSPTGPIQTEEASFAAGAVSRRRSLDMTSDVLLTAPRKRRKTDINTSVDPSAPPIRSPIKTPRSRPLQSTPPSSLRKATLNGVHHAPTATLSAGLLAADKEKGLVPPVPTPPIRRIKLIVRAPEPVYTNPKHKPAPPIFNKSVASALASYTRLESDDVNEDALEEAARERAVLFERVYAMRQRGRMLLSPEDADHARQSRLTDPRTVGVDSWDHVLEAVRTRYRQREASGQEIATTIAAKIRTYWDMQNAKEGKVKLQQEKQLRTLAKATLKLVIAEWKKAVFHIREQERLKREEEETRKGREHLDALLDQSGQILETQHLDLSRGTRSRSRSNSLSASSLHDIEEDRETDTEEDAASADDASSSGDDSNPDQEEPSDGAEDAFLSGVGDDSDDEDEEDEVSAAALLGLDASSLPLGGTTPTSESAEGDVEMIEQVEDNIPAVEEISTAPFDDGSSPHSDLLATPSTDPLLASPHSLVPTPRPIVLNPLPDLTTHSPPPSTLPFNEVLLSVEQKFHPVCQSPKGESQVADIPADSSTADHDSVDEVHLIQEKSILNGDLTFAEPHELVSTPQPISPDFPIDGASPSIPGAESVVPLAEDDDDDATSIVAEVFEQDIRIPRYLKPYAVAPVEWDVAAAIKPPALLRGILRPYQQAGLEWLASIHTRNLNCILADEMGLGKTIQTIALLAHLACDRGIWGPHLIVVPTSVLMNWEMEFKKFLPGFKVLAYYGTSKRRKELRQGWYDKFHFNVCITSYALASRDAHVFKRKPWYYMILDEAHMIKNFKSQRWNILLMFRSFRRLLLTGTPLQNNLTELWALLKFLMSGTDFADRKEFAEWFANPLEQAIEMGTTLDDETQKRVAKLHTVLRPYLLRRLKRDVEKELPRKFEHLVLCPLSKRQRFLYDEFMSRAQTRTDLASGVYQKIANILMQLRKVCNHPDLFEVRPIVTSFAMDRSVLADFEIKELLARRRLLQDRNEDLLNLEVLGLRFIDCQDTSLIAGIETRRLDATSSLPFVSELPGEPPPYDVRTIEGYKKFRAYKVQAASFARWTHIGYLNRLRCSRSPIYSSELIRKLKQCSRALLPTCIHDPSVHHLNSVLTVRTAIKSYEARAKEMTSVINTFACITPSVVAHDLPRRALAEVEETVLALSSDVQFDKVLHQSSVKLQIAFPDLSLLQYDCGKLQELALLLRERKAGGHRVLIFTQMTRILDILEQFLNFHGYLYLRLDGATRIEDRQYITERFNADARIFCFISSSRSGGVGINLTGADTVIFYDSDFNPQMDRQCEDRAHRIGQIRDVHIYRFISQHTVEETMLRKANQKRSLDDLVIQKGEFDWRSLFRGTGGDTITRALEDFADHEDAHAARIAAREAGELEGADAADFGEETGAIMGERAATSTGAPVDAAVGSPPGPPEEGEPEEELAEELGEEDAADDVAGGEDEGGTTVDYMLAFVRLDHEFFRDWRL
ncbi:SNF2 family N-terminal domain-containing protein [Russula earlei]|uniref:SNF2 family N-terminal domain-containing protein n=1 Tax=Russula earlei TaxID=71964 RepID=A0ACC0UI71_9AGAM|nr:SNF2 family N-terminal domain-containing protein [Russula earlei]